MHKSSTRWVEARNTTMKIPLAKKHLFASTPILGKHLRSKAIDVLFESDSKEAARALAGAIGPEHPEGATICHRLLTLRHDVTPEMHRAVWRYWKSRNFTGLVSRIQASDSLRQDLFEALEAMPHEDEVNNTMFSLWNMLDDESLGDLIAKQRRHAPSLETDALFGLARGEEQRYLDLEDPDLSIFEKLWLTASARQRNRISETVMRSRNARLIKAYEYVSLEARNPKLVLDALKAAGNHDALFDCLNGMPFSAALELLDFWARSGERPHEPSKKATLDKAVELYEELATLTPTPHSGAPEGTWELLDFWQERFRSEEAVTEALDSPDPFTRAGALYAAIATGTVGREKLRDVAKNGSWPEKLAVQLHHAPKAAGEKKQAHVCWLRAQTSIEARMLATVLPGSVEESRYFQEALQTGREETDLSAMQERKLLQILTLLQGCFLRGVITVDGNDDATERGALETEDAAEVQW